jgi:hypothetical protein
MDAFFGFHFRESDPGRRAAHRRAPAGAGSSRFPLRLIELSRRGFVQKLIVGAQMHGASGLSPTNPRTGWSSYDETAGLRA